MSSLRTASASRSLAAVARRAVAPVAATSTAACGRTAALLARLQQALLCRLALRTFGEGEQLAARQSNLPVAIDRQHLHLDRFPLLHHVGDLLDAMVRHLGNVE